MFEKHPFLWFFLNEPCTNINIECRYDFKKDINVIKIGNKYLPAIEASPFLKKTMTATETVERNDTD